MSKLNQVVVALTPEKKVPICNNCSTNLQMKQLPDSSTSEKPSPYDDLPPLHTVRYWMSMLATLLCVQSFVFCVVCMSHESLNNMATSTSQVVALELTARKTLVDLGVLTIVVTVGFLLFIKESACSAGSEDIMSPLLVAYKLFQMIIVVDIVVRLLQGLHVTLTIAQINIVYTVTIFIMPIMAASMEITMIVASFIHLQTYYKQTQQQKILAIL
uniref:Uncharacterized protein n=1 Tax=Capitella teleta TaxID=283909 RepID=X2AJP2_CAPTE